MAMELNRRNFVKGAACAAGMGALAVAPALATEAAGAPEGNFTFADTIAWNAEYDVVVVGFGGAGATPPSPPPTRVPASCCSRRPPRLRPAATRSSACSCTAPPTTPRA